MPISAIHLSNAKSLRCARYEAITYHGIDDSGSLLRGRCEVAASRMVRASSSSGRSPHHLAANMIPAAASLMSSLPPYTPIKQVRTRKESTVEVAEREELADIDHRGRSTCEQGGGNWQWRA